MQKWEYRVVDWEQIVSGARREELFNELGQDGWELVFVTDDYAYIFKRSAEPEKPLTLPPIRSNLESDKK